MLPGICFVGGKCFVYVTGYLFYVFWCPTQFVISVALSVTWRVLQLKLDLFTLPVYIGSPRFLIGSTLLDLPFLYSVFVLLTIVLPSWLVFLLTKTFTFLVGFLVYKDFYIIWLSNLWNVNVSDEGYSRNESKVVSSNPAHGEVYSIQLLVIKFVSDLRQVGDFIRVLRLPPPIKLTATI